MGSEYHFSGRATSPGSSRYYSVRMAPPALRNPLALIFEWQWELQAIYYRCTDPGVALTKLQWYRDEFSRALNKQTQHPLLMLLAETVQSHQLPPQPFLEMADAVEMEIRGIIPKDIPALKSYGELGSGNLLQLITQICGGDKQELACASQLGAPVRLIEIIRNLGQDFQLGGCFLPLDMMEQYQLQPSQLAEPENRKALQAVLTALSTHAKEWHALALNEVSAHKRPALIPTLALAASHNSLLSELEKAGFTVLAQRTSLTPLQKLWISWRIYRQYR